MVQSPPTVTFDRDHQDGKYAAAWTRRVQTEERMVRLRSATAAATPIIEDLKRHGVDIQDLTAGFKAWNAATLRGIELNAVSAKGYGFQIEMTFRTLRNGFKVVEVPIRFVDRRVGQSKMSGTIFFEALTLVWSLRARIRPSRG